MTAVQGSGEQEREIIFQALDHGLGYWGHEVDDVSAAIVAVSSEAKQYEAAIAALSALLVRYDQQQGHIRGLLDYIGVSLENDAEQLRRLGAPEVVASARAALSSSAGTETEKEQ